MKSRSDLRDWLGSRLCRCTAVAVSCFSFAFGRPAVAETLTIELDTLGEAPPAYLCVASEILNGKLFRKWLSNRDGEEDPPPRSPDACYADPDVTTLKPTSSGEAPAGGQEGSAWRIKCTKNSSLTSQEAASSGARVVFLKVDRVGVGSELLAGNIIRVGLNPRRQSVERGGIPLVQVDWGSYHRQDAVAFPLNGQNLATKMALRPRCVRRALTLPRFECLAKGEPPSSEGWVRLESPEDGKNGGRTEQPRDCKLTASEGEADCTIPLGGNGTVEAVVETCAGDSQICLGRECESHSTPGYQFRAALERPVPAERIDLHPRRFGFQWEPNCLSSQRECPDVRPGAAFTCNKMRLTPICVDGTLNCQVEERRCMYSCEGDARFPVKLRLGKEGTANQVWDEILSNPGQILRGFTPPEQRRVLLNWSWPNTLDPGSRIRDLSAPCLECAEELTRTSEDACKNDGRPLWQLAPDDAADNKCLQKLPACKNCKIDLEKRPRRPKEKIDIAKAPCPEGDVCCKCRNGVKEAKWRHRPNGQDSLDLKLFSADASFLRKEVPDCSRCLLGHVPDQGSVTRQERAKQPGSEIDYLELRTPEGRVHNLGLGTTQIRVPELECHDEVNLTYKGRLAYSAGQSAFDPETGGVVVPAPETKQRVLFSAAIGGGVNWLLDQKNGELTPAAEADVGVLFPPDGRWKWNLRAAAILAGHWYCYELGRQKRDKPCDDSRKMFPYWRLFAEVGRSWLGASGLAAEYSIGTGHSFYFYERDGAKFQSGLLDGWLFTARGAFGYELVRGITVLLQVRLTGPERVYATTFDEMGVSSHAPTAGGLFHSLPITVPVGLMVRFDDIF